MNQMLWEEEKSVDLRDVWRGKATELASVSNVGARIRNGSHVFSFFTPWMEVLLLTQVM